MELKSVQYTPLQKQKKQIFSWDHSLDNIFPLATKTFGARQIVSLNGTGTEQGRLWSLLLWRYSRPAWTGSCAACCR